MPEMHWRQLVFTDNTCGPFTKSKERIQQLKKNNRKFTIYLSKWTRKRVFFQHDMACEGFEGLARKRASGKILRDKIFNTAKNLKYDGYRREHASMVYNFFNKITSGSGIKNENISNKKLAKELHKSVIRKFKKRKVQWPFMDNIWSADLADMQLITKSKKGFRFLLCLIDVYSK